MEQVKQRFNLDKLKDSNTSSTFASIISTKIQQLPPNQTIQHATDSLIDTLLKTSSDILGKPAKTDIPHWMSESTKQAINEKAIIRARIGTNSTQYKEQKAVVKHLCKIDKQNMIDRDHQELNNLPPDMKYYSVMKRMKLSREKQVKSWGIKSKIGTTH